MKKIDEIVFRCEKILAQILIISMSAAVFLAAIARTIGRPIQWGIDLATFLFAWCVFISGDVALRENKLMNVDFLLKKLPYNVRKWIEVFNYVIILIFLLTLIVFGFYLSYTTRYRTFQGIPNFSYTWVTISVPIGSLLMVRTVVLKIKNLLKN
ncbi:Tripartite ATP-independent periplasmic transporter DctQ component [Caldicellulosiruptor hydrothermalis 108]|uniref:Tripartite ATP-independent periplasmic transporter DctQ component n=1 Tax=Caldicellulosiruptor hydrothermalis (strain DSM 18901 / VKM B-2411 / 108) TaxID=632292 RepID=E4QCF3_CALH1|nr:TRAP transporter small permease [Caldicellulosiruptor hydrothermalis]ADQ06249.1 Tripartite ATP-independent periplasmic transporter DctQ component [Caldicellulosiruptor hydrothermalis 108]